MQDRSYIAGVNPSGPPNSQQPWQQGPEPGRSPGMGPPAGGFPQPGQPYPSQPYPYAGQPPGYAVQGSPPSATLIVSAIATSLISMGGALLQTVMSVKSGFGEGDFLFGSLVLAAAVLTLLFGIGGSMLAMLRGSQIGRVLVTICCLFYLVNGTVTLSQGNTGSIIQLIIAIPLGILWWLPPTSKGMRSKQVRPGSGRG